MKRDWMDIAPLRWACLIVGSAVVFPAVFLSWPYRVLRNTFDRRRLLELKQQLPYHVRLATRGEGGIFTVTVRGDAPPLTLNVDDIATVQWTAFVRGVGGYGNPYEDWALEITRHDGSRVALISTGESSELIELIEELRTRGLVTKPPMQYVDPPGCLDIFMGSLWIIALVWLGTWIWGKL